MIDSNLLERINGRRVIIDACVSRDLANGLRNAGLMVRHVADINSALKDHEIAMMMYADEVLITRDQRFYRMLGQARAILLASGSNTMGKKNNIVYDKPAKRKILARRKSRLPSHVRMALKEKLAEEARTGLLSMKILWGIIWLML
ncbi:MAG: DUF5615 family PIN-like protein [Nitrososphaera sp.]|jgi:predicted nuclease of predicted toxin-antitoxin system